MMQKFPMYAYIPARDMARARKFYEEKVGLKPGPQAGGGVTYEFAKDIERLVAELKGRGVKFEDYGEMPGMKREKEVYSGGGAKAAWFRDSEGNIMALIQEA